MVYTPRPVPQLKNEAGELALWVGEELRNIARSFQESEQVQHTVLHEAPPKPREGMVVVADGTDWNPGSGPGQYTYISGAWVYNGTDLDTSGFMLKSANLSDVLNKATGRDNLGVEIGVDVQAFDAQLSSLLLFRTETASTTLVLSDRSRGVLPTMSAAGQTVTIPLNSTAAFPLGTTITIVNNGGQTFTLVGASAGVTLLWLPSAASGTRTFPAYSIATIWKWGTDFWVITGSGIT